MNSLYLLDVDNILIVSRLDISSVSFNLPLIHALSQTLEKVDHCCNRLPVL